MRSQIRFGTAATGIIGQREIRIFSTHTEKYRLGIDSRIDQIDSLFRAIDPVCEYVIVGGDFNTVREYVLEQFDGAFEDSGFQRASETIGGTARTDPLGVISLGLDHIHTRGFLVMDRGKGQDAEASDHFPVRVKVRF